MTGPYRPPFGRVSRAQRAAAKQREKEFQAALKSIARAEKWRYADGQIFKQDDDWFVSVYVVLDSEGGAALRFTLKPMALDPLFWEIAGLPENNKLSLSFRANGAWTLRPPTKLISLDSRTSDPVKLAEVVFARAENELDHSRKHRSVEQMLTELELEHAGRFLAAEVCLKIMAGDLDGAYALCRDQSDGILSGGFTTIDLDGGASSFLDQAREWIVAKRRSAIRTV